MNLSFIVVLLGLVATPALAHLDPAAQGSVAAGMAHPIGGADHLLAMLAVGFWAAIRGGRALWAVPLAFLAGMMAGYALALVSAPLPFVEPMILVSVVLLGVLVTGHLRAGLVPSVALVAALGLFHGHAHGGELGMADATAFGLGFVLSTAALHATGVVLADYLLRHVRRGAPVLSALGGATALAGVALSLG